jgi:tetratricopeptide (TPR) repeat protein
MSGTGAPGRGSSRLVAAWWVSVGAAVAVRAWNALTGPLLWGYDDTGHLSYVFFLDRYAALPWADQGWSYFHPPLHYTFGWLLAQFGSAGVLIRGYGLLGSAASLAIAGFAAGVTRAASPERPWLPLLAFTAVAFLPVHLYVSPMVGNELACAFFGAAALTALIANERRSTPALGWDVATGCLVGLALLTKFTGALFLAGAVVTIALRPLWSRAGAAARYGTALRLVVVVAVAAMLAAPYYLRNQMEFGTPFAMSRDHALVAQVEAAQAPGERSWRDFVNVSPRLLVDPRPAAPHLVHSVWGTAYVNAWIDTRALWNRLPEDAAARLRWARTAMLLLGLPLTALAFCGALLVIRDVARGRRRDLGVPLLVWAALTLLAFAVFAARVPRVSALKASYLFGLSLPYGVFLARAVEALGTAGGRARGAGAVVALTAAAAAAFCTVGLVHPRRDHHRSLGVVHTLLGDFSAGRSFYHERLVRAPSSTEWLAELADLELASGDAGSARVLYERALGQEPGDPLDRMRLGVAAALAGDLIAGTAHLDFAVANAVGAPALANRGAVRLAAGDAVGAESDLRRALSIDPDLAPAWHTRMILLERADRPEEAETARTEWLRAAESAPRGYPAGVGVGRLHPGRRPLLWLDASGLALARAPFRGGGGRADAAAN